LFAHHYYSQLDAQLRQAPPRTALKTLMYKMFNLDFSHNLFLPIAEEHVVFLRRPHEFPLEKRDVENGGVIVDELEEVDFEGQGVVEFGLSPQ
jgi:hypothetical protein